ncbi:MAG: amidohydrolase family protein [Candidatus Pedobacter colombiensis]|uniref:Amidohydrolase family protein n=1 Tax=Candidatus Pedobacter colombiensis TaxID=3121371 RepID=A0AAJ5WDS4_9SPHI|nr:amidohydrolase family protein [Pedobacter sp.]WEK21731.1 MAG: amidohydrolase family protein [Pedobacter sp.]
MRIRYFLPLIITFLLVDCKNKTTQDKADTIYFGGTIITMEDATPTVEAVVVKDGKIIFTGKKTDADKYLGDSTKTYDLKGKTLLPGFIDAHGHITSRAGMIQTVDLSPTPYGTVNSIPDLQNAIKKYIKDHKIPTEIPLIGNGYDDAIMIEHRHPTRQELDAISETNPIIVIHASGHASVANSAMLKFVGIDENSKDPDGGHYGRDKKTGKLNGKLEENACFTALLTLTRKIDKDNGAKVDNVEDTYVLDPDTNLTQSMKNLMIAQDEWLSYGQTTICDGRTMGESVSLLKEAAARKLLKADVVYFPDFEYFKNQLDKFKPEYMKYSNRLKLGGFKFSDDGSPQGKTAWLTIPYLIPPEGQAPDYKGFPIFTDSVLYNDLKILFQNGITAQLHVNGDAAIDQAIRVIKKLKDEGIYKPELRATLIHVQNSRPDHIQKIKDLGVIPSYFSTHVYLWGDWHYSSVFGPERAAFISPANSALKAGILFTMHHDAPVTPPDLLTAVYAAVNRKTRSGRVLGPNERIKPIEALKAITINAAYQYHEESTKGSLKVGKLADMVILDQDPLTINPEKIREIKVLETIKEGKSVYKSYNEETGVPQTPNKRRITTISPI